MSTFSDIYGYDTIKEHLQNAIKLDKVSHAYIINGGLGAGKKMIAKIFAKALQCEAEGDNKPCNKCHSCIQTESGNQPDIIWVRHEKPASIGVDDVRDQIISDMLIKPYSSRYKIYIIDEAEKLTVQAQNALLKTIEEPPEYAVIILLTTNISALLQTVLSRCVKLDMQPLKKEVVKKYLMEKEKVVDYQADIAVSFAGGNLGKAIELSKSQDFAEMLDEVIQLLRYIKDMQAYEVVAAVKRASEYKFRFTDYIDLMILWFRDVLVYKASQNVNELIFKDEIQTIKKHAAKSSYNGIEHILEAMNKAKLRLKANVNFDVAIEMMFLTIRDNI